MYCTNCRAQLPDGSAFCTQCGAPQGQRSSAVTTKQKVKKPFYKKWWVWVIAVFVLMGVIGSLGDSPVDLPESSESGTLRASPQPSLSTDPSLQPTVTPTPEPTLSPEEQAALDEKERTDFISACVAVNYKDLLRTPDDYVGTKIKVTLGIKQILDEWYSEAKYYRAYTDSSGYGWYMDDEYYVADYREASSGKLLVDDVIVVYGEFTGVTQVTRALTGTSDEIPQISMYYADLISE